MADVPECSCRCPHSWPCLSDHGGYSDMHRWECDLCSPPTVVHVHGRDWVVRLTRGRASHTGVVWGDVAGVPPGSSCHLPGEPEDLAIAAVESHLYAEAFRTTPGYQKLLKDHGQEATSMTDRC